MKIKSISLTNFRQFMGSHKLDLSTSKDKPFNIVLGNNGFGKTTTYRAISWCLFNKEPRLRNKKKEYQAERLNFKVVQKMLINETEYVSVKIIFIDDLMTFGQLNPLTSNPYPSLSMLLKNIDKKLLILPIPSFTFAGVLRETDSVYVEVI